MNIAWSGLDTARWDAAHTGACAPLQQDWAYGSSMQALGVPVLRAWVEADGVPVAMAQFLVRRWGTLAAVALCSRGPVWLQDLAHQDKQAVYAALRRSNPLPGLHLTLITPEEPTSAGLGLAPWRRVMTGYATVMMDLQQTPEALRAGLQRNWRNRLVAAEGSTLKVERMGSNPGQYRWLLDQEDSQRDQRGLAGLPQAFFDHYVQSRQQPAKTFLALRADVGRDRVAGMLFLLHGQAATYQLGWSNEAGRQHRAHHLLLWRGMTELQQRGIRRLDLGGINTARSAGIARFKMSMGGKVEVLAGTYF